MKIIVDAMGGDNAPDAVVLGATNAAQIADVDITLVGRAEVILRAYERNGIKDIPDRIEIVNANEEILIEDDPASAIRTKKDSSLTVGLRLLRDGHGDAFVSAGSTGAILSGATLIVKRIRGIRRAALAPLIPSASNRFVLIDCGANTECTPEYLLQFAFMGSFYSQDVMSISNPRVGLLNNGAESSKGTALQLETFSLLENADRNKHLNFVGNVEAGDAMKGACDVLVCDGFTGNIFLKTVEGTAKLIMKELKSVFSTNPTTKLSYLLVKKHMGGLKEKLSADAVGGTALLGISKPVIKAHGSSNEIAICSAIRQAVAEVGSNIALKLSDNIDKMKLSADDSAKN